MIEISLIIFIIICTTLSLMPLIRESKDFYPYIPIAQFLLVSLFLLLRDPMAAQDADNYGDMYSSVSGFWSIFQSYHGNFVFTFFMFLGKQLSLDLKSFLLIYPVICFSLTFIGLSLLISYRYLPIGLSFLIINPGFILLFSNVLRQGLALSFLLLAIACHFRGKNSLKYLFFVLSIFSHFSSLLIIVTFFITIYFSKGKTKNQIIKMIGLVILITPIILLISVLTPQLIVSLSELGGLFSKINRYSEYNYESNIFYVKLAFSFLLSIANLFIITIFLRKKMVSTSTYIFIFFIQNSILLVFLFLPIPLIASRLLYYSELLVSVVIVNIYRAIATVKTNQLRYINFYLLWLITIMVGAFVYLYPSIRTTTGL